ncbi:LuxR family two component transcriptional regulator [Cereibacter ovatus]|uniref:LuxR family two component transcriptional regulator n=1 Tax=Cereibacter ovatus TaxID=439529 RepID=A0A285CJ62_9RHOB|nr:response regulator transcription factor [Cereibacter ovatus]SNX67559.1 LuxR family two component transcriptional regulator [Cereibacter ovatus]
MGHVPSWSLGCAGAQRVAGRRVSDVLIVDDHPLMCDALAMTLTHAFGLKRVRSAASLAAAEKSLREGPLPDAIVLDLNLPDVCGIEGVMALRKLARNVPLTVISAEVDSDMVTAVMAAGALGYVSKSLPRPQMVDAFERMWAGEQVTPREYDADGAAEDGADVRDLARSFATLTPQQMNILRLICQGRPNKLISYELSIAEATVKTHIAAIMSKINVRNRTQAALLASKARIFAR